MDSFYFIFLFIFFLVLWICVLKYTGFKILTISIPSILIVMILIVQYLGYSVIFLSLDHYRAEFFQNKKTLLATFLITSYTITALILSFILAKKTFGPLHLKNEHTYIQNLIVNDRQLSRFILYLLFIFSVFVLLTFTSKIGFNNIALLAAFNLIENNSSLEVLRSNMGSSFDGKYHWYSLFMRDFLLIASNAFYGFYLLRKKLFYLIIFIISFFITCFSLTIALEKLPLILYFFSLTLNYVLIKQNSQLIMKQIILLGFFVFLLGGFMFVYFMGSQDLLTGFKNSFFRITVGQITGQYHYLQIFPDKVNFLWGRSFPNPGGIFLFDHYNLQIETFDIIFPQKKDLGFTGSMPTFFWGEMYANFGYVGILITPFFIGFFLHGFNIFLLRLPKTPIFLSFYVFIIVHCSLLSITSFSKVFVNIKIIIIIILLMTILSAPNNLKLRLFKSRS